MPVDGVVFGGEEVVVIAGPCSVESEDQLWETARAVKAAGATVLRAGAFKPRTSPYSFQGLGETGLKMLDRVRTGARPGGRHRGASHPSTWRWWPIRRHAADRRAQHAELHAAPGGRAQRPARSC